MKREDLQMTLNGGLVLNGAMTHVGALGLTGNLTQTGNIALTGDLAQTGDFALTGLLGLVAQEEEVSGAQSIDATSSLMTFSDPASPAASNITLGTTGLTVGQILYVLNLSATDENVVLLAASLVGSNPITLASENDFTVLMWNGTAWLNIGGTAPA